MPENTPPAPTQLLVPTLDTERLHLRLLTDEDWPVFYALAREPSFTKVPLSDEAAARRAFATLRTPPDPGKAAGGTLAYALCPRDEDGGAVVGPMVGFCRATLNATGDEAEIGFAVLPEHRGQGYATEAARALIDHLFASGGVRRVLGGCFAGNAASRRVLQKLGLRRNPPDWFERVITFLRLQDDLEVWFHRDAPRR